MKRVLGVETIAMRLPGDTPNVMMDRYKQAITGAPGALRQPISGGAVTRFSITSRPQNRRQTMAATLNHNKNVHKSRNTKHIDVPGQMHRSVAEQPPSG